MSEGAGSADTAISPYEIVAYLKGQGLDRIAVRVSEELGLEEIDDLRHVEFEEIGQLEWVKPVQKKKLLELVRKVTACLMSADESDLSGDDTISQGASTHLARSVSSPYHTDFESDSEEVLVAARNGGDCADFQVHMQSFIKSWRWHLETDSAQESFVLGDSLSTSWTACMFLWIRFAHDATLDQRLHEKRKDATTNSPNQDQLLSILTECLESPGTTHTHPCWSPDEPCECRKQHAIGIFFTDRMVQHAFRRNEAIKKDGGIS